MKKGWRKVHCSNCKREGWGDTRGNPFALFFPVMCPDCQRAFEAGANMAMEEYEKALVAETADSNK